MKTWKHGLIQKIRNYFGVALVAGALVLGLTTLAKNPRTRQPSNVSAVQVVTKPVQIKRSMMRARKSAERLDRQASYLMKVTYIGWWARWRAGIDLDDLHEQFSRDLTMHLSSMTQLMKFRREHAGFQKLQEFDFQNLLRKSDYLLALPISKNCFEYLEDEAEWKRVVQNYNRERLIFDEKKIIVAGNDSR